MYNYPGNTNNKPTSNNVDIPSYHRTNVVASNSFGEPPPPYSFSPSAVGYLKNTTPQKSTALGPPDKNNHVSTSPPIHHGTYYTNNNYQQSPPHQQPQQQQPKPQQQPQQPQQPQQQPQLLNQSSLQNMKEIKLCNNNIEREMYDNLAELYSIIKVTEHLEKAYIRDDVVPKDYTTACSKLIAQFKSSQNLVKDHAPNISQFMKDYDLNCKAAFDRLVIKGFPSTLEHSTQTESSDSTMAKNVAEAVQNFITTMDSIRLKLVAVDGIYPLLSDLMESLNRNTWLGPNFEGKEKIKNWISILNQMKATDELDDEQSRQLLFDLDSSYNVFYKAIKS
ncbi:hypothetical protein CYY_004034 [Polysphondylium violaceum]|uniref:Vacuolar protein sorting-associated protein 28 n=1 Tax=Polysphondylium violaceum TaxID=133409 RepID=A0A8J4V845_9MYCE|nr:hypothetical protein CYY_004034 [Polysphondylium violaceum]